MYHYRQICEVSDSSCQLSELCTLPVPSLSKDHARFLVTCYGLRKGVQFWKDGDKDHVERDNITTTQDTKVATRSDIISCKSDIITTNSTLHMVPQPIDHYIRSKVASSLQASDYHQVIILLDHLAQTQTRPPNLGTKCVTLMGCGLAYYKLGRYHEAVLQFQGLVEACRPDPSLRGTQSLAHTYLGDIACARNSHEEAAGFYEQAVAHHSKDNLGDMFMIQMPSLAQTCIKWGQALRKVSKIMQAVAAFNKAIAMATDKKEEMSARISLGNMLQSLGDHRGAIDEYRLTVLIAHELNDNVSLGWSHGNMGNAYLGKGERDKALHHLATSLDLTLVHEATPQAIGRAYNNLGTAYQAMGEVDKAQEHYRLALDQATFGQDVPGQARAHGNLGNVSMLKKEYDRAHQSYTEVLELSGDRSLRSVAHHNRGCCLYEKAEDVRSKLSSSLPLPVQIQKLYEDASKDFEEVVLFHEESLHTIRGSPQGLSLSVGLFEANSSTFQRLVDCLFSLGRSEDALVVAEQCRSRTLGELLLKRSLQKWNTPISYKEMCAIVQSQPHTVVYFAYTGAHLIMWALNPYGGTVTMAAVYVNISKDLFGGKTLDFHLRHDLPEMIADTDHELFGHHDYKERSPLHQLFEVVGKPLLELLSTVHAGQEDQQIILVPDSYTSIPITALCDNTRPSFLGDRFAFRVMPSLLTMALIDQSPFNKEPEGLGSVDIYRNNKDHFCIVGDPSVPSFVHNGEEVSLGRLPHAEEEARWVANTLGATATLGTMATKQSVLRMLQTAKVVHIATHGGSSSGYLAFAGGGVCGFSSGRVGPVEASDVLLFPHEVEQLTISPALVVLSSCSSARGKVSADGVVSMARAFLLAGAQAILTTLWKVPDESAGVFMKFFYQYLVDGLTSAQAVHKATLSVRFFKKYAKYLHWGAYQLMGKDIRFAPLPKGDETVSNLSENAFSQLEVLAAIECALMTKTQHQDPAPVQILHGPSDLDPSECAVDFIQRHHHHFKAIFYISGTCDELLEAAELAMKEVLPTIAPADRLLVVLNGVETLSRLSDGLVSLLKRTNTSIIFIYTSVTPPTSIVSEVDSLLVRGCGILHLAPLTHTHCTQRMVHRILSRTDILPTNKEQEVMSLLCDLTRGSPVLADIASEVVCAYYEGGDDDVAMERLMMKVIQPSLVANGTKDDLLAHACILVGGLNLDRVEHLTLCSLAMYGSCPVPSDIVTKISGIILSALPNCQYTEDHVVQRLLKRRLVKLHPSVVLAAPAMSYASTLYQVPQLVIDAILHGTKDAEIVLAAGIAHKAIVSKIPHGDHAHVTPTTVTALYCVALSRGLIQTATTFASSEGLASLDLYTELYRPIAQIYGKSL